MEAKMRSKLVLLVVLIPLLVACASTKPPRTAVSEESVQAYDARNASLAQELFGMTFDSKARTQSQLNFSAIRTDDLLFSRRIDSRTYIMYDRRASEAGTKLYEGPDSKLLEIATALLQRASIPTSEIARPRVLQVEGRVASFDPLTKVLSNVKNTKEKRFALVNRQIEGLPVFSSRLLLVAAADGRPGFAELHWPEIPNEVIAEARRLQRLVREGWKAPEQKGARVETIEAGIVHSPAAALVMDIIPVIRVIYASNDPKVGGKAMLYFDRSGQMVTPPREFPVTPCPGKPRESSKQ
jgi:hypothetical protein